MKQNEVKKKLKALSTPGVKALICDILMNHDSDIGTYDQEAGAIGYARYTERICNQMKSKYEKQIQKDTVTVQTRDLEELITSLKNGSEPGWKNKLNRKDGNTTG